MLPHLVHKRAGVVGERRVALHRHVRCYLLEQLHVLCIDPTQQPYADRSDTPGNLPQLRLPVVGDDSLCHPRAISGYVHGGNPRYPIGILHLARGLALNPSAA